VQKDKIGEPLFISLLNGLGSKELIINNFGNNFITGSIGSIEVYRDDNGVIQQPLNQAPAIDFAKESEVTDDCFKSIINIIESIGISTSIFSDHNEVIWRKLVRLGAIASSTAAFQKSIGEIRADKDMRKVLIGLINEGSAIANSIGVKTNISQVIDQIDLLPHNLQTSLSRDIAMGRPSELQSITIAIINKAKQKNISTPVYESILSLIKDEYVV
jgi:2-dehydropantoate 2-reductase